MEWPWLTLGCLVASFAVHTAIRQLWIAIPLACFLGPALYLFAAQLVTGEPEAFGGIVLVIVQIVAIPVAVAVGAGVRAVRA